MKNPNLDSQVNNLARYHWQFRGIIVVLLIIGILIPVAIVYAQISDDYKQCSDNYLNGTQCNFVAGQMSNAYWMEGESVPQRAIWDGLPNQTSHTFTWSVTWMQGVTHGYDFLTSWQQAQALHQYYAGAPLDLNPCDSANGGIGTACTNLTSGTYYTIAVNVPDDPFISGSATSTDKSVQTRINNFENLFGNRFIEVRSNRQITAASLTFYHAEDKTGFPAIGSGGDAGASNFSTLIRYTLVYTTANSGNNDYAMVMFATHFGLTGNTDVDRMAWGYDTQNTQGLGASGLYPSAPWHVKDFSIDGVGGSQDNQAKVAAPTAFPIVSNAAFNTGTHTATDSLTMTAKSGSAIEGVIKYYVCGDNTVPYTDTLTVGCALTQTQQFTGASPQVRSIGANTTTVWYLGPQNVSVTSSGGSSAQSNGTSPSFTAPSYGQYCFLTVFSPTRPAGGQLATNFPPTADTNGTTECFLYTAPTAVTLRSIQATSDNDAFSFGGFSVIGLALGMLGIVSSFAVWKFRFSQN